MRTKSFDHLLLMARADRNDRCTAGHASTDPAGRILEDDAGFDGVAKTRSGEKEWIREWLSPEEARVVSCDGDTRWSDTDAGECAVS